MEQHESKNRIIEAGVKEAIAQAIERHRRLGQSIAVWKDGQVAIVPPEEIPDLNPNLDSATAKEFLEKLPEHIRTAFYDRAAEIDYPVEAVLESAIAFSLDPEALSFADCKPSRS